ncbi:hypothetical protein T484DRAFT_2329012 [Baffinella frigidus]|nr:hypothetical protein T484DRAFT_2329012 [Cryptophyta sp. CCMP2293]
MERNLREDPCPGSQVLGFGFRVPGSGFMVDGLTLVRVRAANLGPRLSGFRVPGSGIRVSGSWLRVSG